MEENKIIPTGATTTPVETATNNISKNEFDRAVAKAFKLSEGLLKKLA